MRHIKRTIQVLVLVILFLFLNYALPQRDIVRVTGVEQISNFQTNWPVFFAQSDQGTTVQDTFSLRLIQTVRKRTWLFGLIDRGEQTMIFRNQDTGIIWPPYFKFDSSDLQGEAQDLRSEAAAPRWAIMTHYGWRIIFITVYPNAISLTPIDDPNIRIIPWFNIIFLASLALAWFFLRRMWRQFRQRTVDPTLSRVDQTWDGIEAGVTTQKGRIGRWLNTWRRK